MENKEVEQIIDMFENYQFLGDLQQRKQKVKDHINSLEQQLKAKDKALDKACSKVATITGSCPYDSHNYQPTGNCDKHCKVGMEKEGKCWKEMYENGID